MPTPQSPPIETQARVVFEKGGDLHSGPTPESRRIADAYRRTIIEGGHRSAAEKAAARKLEADRHAAHNTILENIGEKEDPATGKMIRRGKEKERFEDAIRYEGAISDFIKGGRGWEGLTDSQRNLFRDRVRDEIKKWVNPSDPNSPDYFEGMTQEEINSAIDRFLTGDMDVFDKVKELYGNRLVNTEVKISTLAKEKTDALEKIEKDIKTKQEEIDNFARQQVKYQAVIDEDFRGYDEELDRVEIPNQGMLGQKAQIIHDIDERIATDFSRDKIRALKVVKANKEGELARLREDLNVEIKVTHTEGGDVVSETPYAAGIRAEIRRAETELREAEGELNKYNALIEDREKLIEERKNAKEKVKEFEGKHNETELELKDLQRKEAVAKTEIEAIKHSREEAEEAFVSSIKNILPDAVSKVFEERIGKLEEAYANMIRAEINDPNTNPHRRALLKGLELRYEKFKEDYGFMHIKDRNNPGIGGREINKQAITEDINTLKSGSEDAAENIIKRVLLRSTNPDTGRMYTESEIDALGSDFVKDNIGDVTAGLIAKGLQTGQIKLMDMEAFVRNGHITEEKMVEAFVKHNEQLRRSGISEKAIEEIKKLAGNKKLLLFLLLFALSPLVATGVGIYVVGKEIVKPEKAAGHGRSEEAPKNAPAEESSSETEQNPHD